MKTSTFALALLGFFPAAFAQSTQPLAPSPTESVGCQPHGDHWHCEGPRETADEPVSVTAAATTSAEDHDHDETGSGSLAPSPTESVGCQPHGDHWHCEGPATTAATATGDDDDHDHEAGSGSLAPSPTESVGCEPHGDHWHCDGPATADVTPSGTSLATVASGSSSGSNSAASATESPVSTTGVPDAAVLQAAPVLGALAAALLAL